MQRTRSECRVIPEEQSAAVRATDHAAVPQTPQVPLGQNTMKVRVVLAVEVDERVVDVVEEQSVGEISYTRAMLDDVDDQLVVGRLGQEVDVIFVEYFSVEHLRNK